MDINNPDDLKQTEDRTRKLLKRKKYAEALALCEDAKARGLESGKLHCVRASALVGLKRWEEAWALIEEGLEKYPREPGTYLAQTFFLGHKRQFGKVLDVCDYAESIGVWNGRLAANKGTALLRLGKEQEALAFMASELEKYPDEPILHYNLGVAYQWLGKKNEFEREVEIAIAADPTLADLLTQNKQSARLVRSYQAFYFSLIYLIIAILFWPSSRYFLIPLWLFWIALGIFGLYFALRIRRSDLVFLTLLLFLSVDYLG